MSDGGAGDDGREAGGRMLWLLVKQGVVNK